MKTLVCLLVLTLMLTAQTARVVTYNILNYENNSRDVHFRVVMDALDADIVVVQEINDQADVDNFLNNVLNHDSVEYAAAPFSNGFSTDNALFYRISAFSFLSALPIPTTLRQIDEFTLNHIGTNESLVIYSVHLKAGSDPSDQAQRLDEVNTLRGWTENLPGDANFLLAGDFNTRSSGEAAYQALLDQSDSGYFIDPINRPGGWHNNAGFAAIHTQSPRTRTFGGGSPGGLDDRFDFILVSQTIMDMNNVNFVEGSYDAYGNDGLHFNDSINVSNTAVSAEIADALHYASDHLPVVCELQFGPPSDIRADQPTLPNSLELFPNYPNPFNPRTTLRFVLNETVDVTIAVYDVAGREVQRIDLGRQLPGRHEFNFDAGDLQSGIYYYYVNDRVGKMVLVK